jgi:hypothetical protein
MKMLSFLIGCGGLGALALLAGCNIIGAAYVIAHGPEKVPAVYTLPREKSAVIAVDDRASILPQRSLREVIGSTAEKEILSRGLVKDMIASHNATAVMARERYGSPLTVDEIGQAVGADVVIYVVIDKFLLSEDGQTFMPVAQGRMKVIDSKSGTRLTPMENGPIDFHPFSVNLPTQSSNVPKNPTEQLEALQDLASLTGVAISQLFYDAEKINTEPSRLKERK